VRKHDASGYFLTVVLGCCVDCIFVANTILMLSDIQIFLINKPKIVWDSYL